ncbi:MAG TPA: riboflavin synthase [Spirochaetota bacterium]|nr:riboflavin synthase [Spirochaetota bacterium]HOS33923.1 riboflavin synthase [Spirochaetota bacterium]HOS56880.1 riboflavin synthase [Spirochaetota bacterium]HPK62443.1 riboflavin synthase [Spirochaetota bacterium]HQF78546.1 riboflavin synthase [Spirochaetota bacterium]
MFTGIIEEIGALHSFSNDGKLKIVCNKILDDIKIGDSVAVNGVCLTVVSINNNILTFHVSKTTSDISNFKIGRISNNAKLNLERALRLDSRLGGHIVQGHIDGIAKIIRIDKRAEDHFFEFFITEDLRKFIIPKGSVAIDGISLTISAVLSASFEVTVIPQTLKETNLKERRIGDYVHIETDFFVKYVSHVISNGGYYDKNKEVIRSFF